MAALAVTEGLNFYQSALTPRSHGTRTIRNHVGRLIRLLRTSTGNYHEVNPRDKVLAALMIEKLRRGNGVLTKADFQNLPFDDLTWNPGG